MDWASLRRMIWIAVLNIILATIALEIHALTESSSWYIEAETIFSKATFPLLTLAGLGCVRGSVLYWTGGLWAIPLFYVLIVLNACVWGVVLETVGCWFHRTFWARSPECLPYDDADLKLDARFMVYSHAVLLMILVGVLTFLVPVPFQVLLGTEFSGALPLSARLLLETIAMWRNGFADACMVLGFLLIDGPVYSYLCRTRGKRLGTLWASGVASLLGVAIVWYMALTLIFLHIVLPWRLH